ncbi:uncharacterized protein LOC135348378 [Halichondria panicea]|uniref:uncharacterized protein LOC135348378 n=1 Tax=Halichondria panicea TaxID=6063 RepID=UPI00312B6027
MLTSKVENWKIVTIDCVDPPDLTSIQNMVQYHNTDTTPQKSWKSICTCKLYSTTNAMCATLSGRKESEETSKLRERVSEIKQPEKAVKSDAEDGQELTNGTIFTGASTSMWLDARNIVHTSIGKGTTVVKLVTLGPSIIVSECAKIYNDFSDENNRNRALNSLNNEFSKVTTVVEHDKDCVQTEDECVTLEPCSASANTSFSVARNDLSKNDGSNCASNFIHNRFGVDTVIGERGTDFVRTELQYEKVSEVKQTAQMHKRLALHSADVSSVDNAFESSSICPLVKENETIRLENNKISKHSYSFIMHSSDIKILSKVHSQQEKVAVAVAQTPQILQTGFVLPNRAEGSIVLSTFADETCNTGIIIPLVENEESIRAKSTLLEIPQDVLAPEYALTAKLRDPESSSDESGVESNEEYKTKIRRKIIGYVPRRRQLLVFYSRREKKSKIKTRFKIHELSDSENDDDLPNISQEKSYNTQKVRRQHLTLSRYSHVKLRCNTSGELAYMEADSSQTEGSSLDSATDDVVDKSFPEDAKCVFIHHTAASTDTHLRKVQSARGQLCNVLIKHKGSVVGTHVPRRRKNIRVQEVSSACRGVRKIKQAHRVITTSASEVSSDYSKSAIVLESFSQRNLFAIKALKTPTSNFVGILSHEKLSQSNIGLVDQTTTSETSSQEQLSRYISATTVRTNSMRLPTLAAAKNPSVSSPHVPPAMAAESPVKSKGQKGRSLRVQVDGERKASLLNTVTAASIPQLCSTRTSERNSPRENDSSLQRSIPTRRSPDWIAIATKLLHVPDYQKMIQILNGVTPAQEDVVAHKFIRGIAYFKVGKLRQAMDDLHECEKFALESIEDERRAHSQRQLDSGVFSMQPGSQASSQASSLQYLQQSSKKGDVAVCNVYMGDLHYTSGSYLEASKCYQRAADLYDRECVARLFRMVPPTISTIHSKCGSCLRNLSKSMEAIQEYRNAIETAIRDKDRLAAHTSLGNLQQTLGQNKEALVEYEHALDLAETLNEHMSVGWTHGNIGNAFLGLNEKDKALFHLQKALDITIKYEPKPDSIGRAYNNLGTAYQSMGDLDKAEEHYDLALSQAIYGNDPAGQSRVYGNIGNIYIVRKRFEKAIPHYTEVLRLSKDEATISTAHHNRGCALYEWAESKMLALEQSLQKTSSSNEPTFRFHGSQTTLPQKHSPRIVIDSIAKLFRDGMSDLQKVAETHEAKLDHIKGSAKGLSLSVSLTESNSRTFHRLQDCMVAIGNWREALLIAEQSRARTLGEIMLARKESQLEKALTSPLNLEHVYSIVSSQKSPVLYLTHTGASLFGWVLVPAEDSDSISIEMFEIPISDDQFDGKSFDYHIRYGLTEVLVEQSYEMYRSIDYDEETTAPVAQLFKVIGKPFQMTLDRLLPGNKKAKMQKIVLITDTYTSLLPFTCMYDPDSETFLGDHYYFETMQSLLTMGIMNQLPEPMVELPADPQSMCIVGNPIIPKFYLNGEVWSLGKLPYARREAQWVGHILNTPPILDEQATKSAVVMRFMRAKVIHIATHGSSVSGFLAFASLTSTRQGEGVDSSGVLLHPEEVEKLSISPALVVLSSCDSSRGTVKADGVQGMARAFLLAGAQAVLTALWRVPDESAAVFMRFFYRFLENGFESSLSLQKAILSLRCFSKYSQYIHWSGYQLTGRSIRLDMKPSPVTTMLESTLRPSSPFPRLMLVKKLESVLVDNPRLPTDIQILHGSPGVKPSEIAIDFIHSCHAKFAAGIFWISCRTPDIIDASLKSIEKTIDKPLNKLRLSDTQQALVVLDNAIELPNSGKLISFLKHTNVHIIILSKSADPIDSFVKEVDKALIRGCSIHEVKTLSTIDSTQRIVYEISKQYYLKANNNDQAIFEKLAEFTSGSPLIVDIAAQVLLKYVQENSDEPSEGLNQFADSIQLSKSRKVIHKSPPLASSLQGVEDTCFQVREISDAFTRLVPNVASVSPNHTDVWESESEYDSWDSIGALIQRCVSTPGEMLLLQALSIFGCIPIPIPLVTTMSSLIAQSSGHSHLGGILHERLMEAKLILRYPQPVVLHSTYTKSDKASEEPLFLYLPQHLASQLWLCNDIDQVMAVTVAYKALQKVIDENSAKNPELLHFYLGLIPPLEEKTALLAVEKKHCYEAVYELYLQLSHQLSSNNHTHI